MDAENQKKASSSDVSWIQWFVESNSARRPDSFAEADAAFYERHLVFDNVNAAIGRKLS